MVNSLCLSFISASLFYGLFDVLVDEKFMQMLFSCNAWQSRLAVLCDLIRFLVYLRSIRQFNLPLPALQPHIYMYNEISCAEKNVTII